MYVFLTKGGNNLVSGYPKRLEKELGSPPGISLETIDAAFSCPGSSRLYVSSGEVLLGTKGCLVLLTFHGIDDQEGIRRANSRSA